MNTRNAMPRLLLRADATTAKGTGHVMRCLALAQAWQERGGTVAFVSHCESDALQERIVAQSCTLVSLSAEAAPCLAPLLVTAATLCPDWIVLDGYHFTTAYQRAVRCAGFRTLVLDDYAHLSAYDADLLLNQNAGAESLSYAVNRDARLLRGTDYVLLRREFVGLTPPAPLPCTARSSLGKGGESAVKPFLLPPDIPSADGTLMFDSPPFPSEERAAREGGPGGLGRLLVTLGGSDPANATALVMQALSYLPRIETRVVLGAANPHRAALGALRSENMELLTDVREMPALMAWADIAVCAGGTTCWECAFMGLPAVVLTLADNQRGIACRLHEAGAALSVGEATSLQPEGLAEQIACLLRDEQRRRAMSEAGRKLVDGRGAARVVAVLRGEA